MKTAEAMVGVSSSNCSDHRLALIKAQQHGSNEHVSDEIPTPLHCPLLQGREGWREGRRDCSSPLQDLLALRDSFVIS